jgi:peptide/nickel transport system substrate-binding protein
MLTAARALAAPAISRSASTLRFVPQADLTNFDPIWNTQYMVRNAAMLVWDTLYGVDERLRPQRQMVDRDDVSNDGLTWTFRLRPNLVFHDGAPVLAADVVASINRWAARDVMGLMLKAIEDELSVIDDRTFRWILKRPFRKMRFALGKIGAPCCFIMPARIAATKPFTLINEFVGSGPMKFAKDEWIPGARAVFEKFVDYVPRGERPSWLAGSKRILIDRAEWMVLPDPATAAAALQTGEVDWWENPINDLLPPLKKNQNITVDVADPLGNVGALRINHLHPPFNDVRARRAILMAMSQQDYMRAIVGIDDTSWKPMPSVVTPGTPLYTEEGGEILKGPRDIEAAKRLLGESGYAGEQVTCLVPQDVLIAKSQGEVTADLLRRLGMNVDFAAIDWGTLAVRRMQKAPPSQGGWSVYPTWHAGAVLADPTNIAVRANGDKAFFGWPDNPEVEAAVNAWYEAGDLEGEKAAMRRLNKAALQHVVFAPTGFFLQYQAWRKTVGGIVKGPLPFFWGVSKAG